MDQPSELAGLFSGESFRFQMGLRRRGGHFFANTAGTRGLLDERRHWLESTPQDCTAILEEGVPLLNETIQFAKDAGVSVVVDKTVSPLEQCMTLGKIWEPDFLLLNREGEEFRLRGGCLCFPSFWVLSEKLGHPVSFIHGPVPTLNGALGTQIQM